MQKKSYRTTMPFDGGLSTPTNKTTAVPMFGGTPLIQDLIEGNKEGYDDIKGRGSWSSEPDDDHSFHESGDEYRLDEDLRKLDVERSKGQSRKYNWVAKMEDGSEREFPTLEELEVQTRIMGKPVRRIVKKKAADTSLVAKWMEACAGVVSKTASGGGKGASFCIAKGRFMTCAHVIRNYAIGVETDDAAFMAEPVSIVLSRGGQSAPGRLVAVDVVRDIAIVEADLPSEILSFSNSMGHDVGESVLIVGSPKGFENEVSEGIVSSLDRIVFTHEGAPRHVFTDAKILPGNSGGPMISQKDGTVIGMVEIIVGEGEVYGLNAAIASEFLTGLT